MPVAVVALALFLRAGHDRRWSWTGFGSNDTLWDRLHLLLLPVAVAALPLWLRERARTGHGRRLALGALGVAFAALVVAGYLLDLGWTGFPGNRLWDWLELLVLPLVLATVPLWMEMRHALRLHHRLILAALIVALAVAVTGGYALDWAWTGFEGNTLWDWIQLLLVPLLIPTVLLPATVRWLTQARQEEAAGGPEDRVSTSSRAGRRRASSRSSAPSRARRAATRSGTRCS